MPILVIIELEDGEVVSEAMMRLLLDRIEGTSKRWACQAEIADLIKKLLTDAEDAEKLWAAFGNGKEHQWPRDAGKALGMTPARVDGICAVWAQDSTKYEYGACVDLGWKVEEQDV